jgi:hypothetical protein
VFDGTGVSEAVAEGPAVLVGMGVEIGCSGFNTMGRKIV